MSNQREAAALSHLPRLSEHELAVAVQACKQAGAVNAAVALSRHVSRVQIEADVLRTQRDELAAALRGMLAPAFGQGVSQARRAAEDALARLEGGVK